MEKGERPTERYTKSLSIGKLAKYTINALGYSNVSARFSVFLDTFDSVHISPNVSRITTPPKLILVDFIHLQSLRTPHLPSDTSHQ